MLIYVYGKSFSIGARIRLSSREQAAFLLTFIYRYGTILVKTCKSYHNADLEIRESVLKIEARWFKIQQQLELLRRIWPSLEEDYQLYQNSILHVLQGKAQAAISLVDSIIGKSNDENSIKSTMSKKGDAKRIKYAVWVKNSLENVSKDLHEWSEIFDVSWYLIIRMTDSTLNQQLDSVATKEDEPVSALKDLREAINASLISQADAEKNTVFLPQTFFTEAGFTPLEFGFTPLEFGSSTSGVWSSRDGKMRCFIDQASTISTLPDVCKLAKILRKVDPLGFAILACKGVVKSALPDGPGFSIRFMFNIPSNLTHPQYLRTVILKTDRSRPLDVRFLLAKQLAKAVMFVHSTGFVHKNIRPDTILILQERESTDLWPFLTGFEKFRLAEGNTIYQGDDAWEKNLYRHPQRQGTSPEFVYAMQHDIYSLGVCLLEIGLGQSFVVLDSEDSKPTPSPSISDTILSPLKDKRKKAFNTKRFLVSLATDELPAKMGRKFTNTVLTCLTCLDSSDNMFGDESEFLDENGILVGVRFIEKVRFPHGLENKLCRLISQGPDYTSGSEDMSRLD